MTASRRAYFRFGVTFPAGPGAPNGFGGTAAPRPAPKLDAPFGFLGLIGALTTEGTSGTSTNDGTTSGDVKVSAGATTTGGSIDCAQAAFEGVDGKAVERGSSAVPIATSAAVPTATQTPTNPNPIRAPTPAPMRDLAPPPLTPDKPRCEETERMGGGASLEYTWYERGPVSGCSKLKSGANERAIEGGIAEPAMSTGFILAGGASGAGRGGAGVRDAGTGPAPIAG